MGAADWRGLAERIRRTATPSGRAGSGYFSLEGLRLHERAWRAGAPVVAALVSVDLLHSPSVRVQSLLAGLSAAGCRLTPAPPEALAELTGGRGLGDILGLVPLPAPPPWETLLAPHHDQPPLILAAVDIVDPGNVGALVRTGHASGVSGFVAVGVSDPFYPRAVQTSRGSLFKLPVRQVDSAESLLPILANQGVATVGATVSAGVWLPEARWPSTGLALLMGNEAAGLAPVIQARLDLSVRIPMAEGIDSFSVNAAAAIILYEIQRGQKWGRM